MAKISQFIDAKLTTATTRATAADVAAKANQELATATASDDAAGLAAARALKKVGPTLVTSTPPASWDSPDGLVIHVTPLNTADVDVPEDAPPADPSAPA